ncbi:MAG: Dam family site-specific DNA-(adenine-N6)-methyltransferase [Phototrophicaceae bacterium]|jgi:DNA adenine methylase
MTPIPHPFPYQGSKRLLADKILAYIPVNTARLVEPFAGSAALSIAALAQGRVQSAFISDVNQPLIALWRWILECPEQLAAGYQDLWQAQFTAPEDYYNTVRERFNQTHQPDLFLFLLLRCVKAAVRYNHAGEFNQAPDKRRHGTHPAKVRQQLLQTAQILRGTQLAASDYQPLLMQLAPEDVVYLDPPYQGVSQKRDPRYLAGVPFDGLVSALTDLNRQNIAYLVSYDGKSWKKVYGQQLPPTLDLMRIELLAGRSSQATLLGEVQYTTESLYLSPALVERLSVDLKLRDVA